MIMAGEITLLSLKFDRNRKTFTMGKSQFALLLLYFFTIKAKTGFALLCYGCTDASWVNSKHDTIANDATECGSDFGKVFNCSGLCVKVFSSGISEIVKKMVLYWQFCFTLFKLAQRYCTSMEIPIGCVYKSRQTKYVRIDAVGCACDSDLCNTSVKMNVSMDQSYIFIIHISPQLSF